MSNELVPYKATEVIAKPHPLQSEVVHAYFPQGFTIAQMLGPAVNAPVRVEIGGIEVPRKLWAMVRPKPGVVVYVTRFPEGGGAKNIIRSVAFVILAIYAPYLAAYLGYTGIAAAAITAGVMIVGSLAINALIPPQIPKFDPSGQGSTLDRLRSITGTQNNANPYGPIPCIIGTMRLFPPLAALPFSELHGDDQYLRMLFDLGYGDPQISDMKIGDNPLSNFENVEYEISTAPSLFSDDVTETAASDVMNNDGNSATRTSDANADELSIDLVFPVGLFGFDKKGHAIQVTCDLLVQYAPTGTTNWVNVTLAPGLTISNGSVSINGGNIRITSAERKVLRFGLRWKVTSGQYDIKVTRVNTNWGSADANSRAGDLQWAVVRTIRHTNPSTTGTKKLALRIKATDQLNGTINQFNCIAAQPIPVWDGVQWVTQVSDNPAWVYYWILNACPANPRHVDASRIDLAAISDWAAECTAKEYTYDAVIDHSTTVFDLLKEVCAAGRASFTVRDGKYSIVRDVSQSTPVQHFSPRNSWGFQGQRTFLDTVHALRVRFINPQADYQQDEMTVYDDGYDSGNATKFETLELNGTVNANGAWRLARYHLAVARLRPHIYSWNADIEHIVCQRGDLIRFASDVVSVGLAWGRIKSVTTDVSGNVTSIVVDEPLEIESGKTYAVRIRSQDGSSKTTNVSASIGSGITSLSLSSPQAGVHPGDLFLFGISGQESIEMVVTKIEPSSDLSAKITAVDAAPAVLTADSGTPPTFISTITGKPWGDPPPPPNIIIIQSDQKGSFWGDGGTTSPRIQIGIGGPPSFRMGGGLAGGSRILMR